MMRWEVAALPGCTNVSTRPLRSVGARAVPVVMEQITMGPEMLTPDAVALMVPTVVEESL